MFDAMTHHLIISGAQMNIENQYKLLVVLLHSVAFEDRLYNL